MHSLTIGLLTYKREEGLRTLLHSIRPESCTSLKEILVVHTAAEEEGLGTRIVEGFPNLPLRWIPANGQRRSIPEGRNCILDNTRTSHLLFVDDDQCLQPETLEKLEPFLHDARAANAVLRLKVNFCFEDASSPVAHFIQQYHEKKMRPFSNPDWEKRRMPGKWVATNGVLLPILPVNQKALRLVQTQSYIGGEDNDFFHRIEQAGHPSYYLHEVSLNEFYPRSRTCLADFSRRAFREGLCFALLHLQRQVPLSQKLIFFIKASGILPFAILKSLFGLPFGPLHGIGGWQLSLRQAGKFAALCGSRFSYYK
jgi:hypothetical protein